MATLIVNTFSSFELTTFEEEQGQVLNPMQKMVLQNKLAAVATQKVNLVYDPLNALDFAMQVSYLQGQMDVITWQIETSNNVEEILATRLQQQE